jgi:hypothetical protein
MATVFVRTEIPAPAPTAKSDDRLSPDVVASLISAPLEPVCKPYPLRGANVKLEPVSNTPLLAEYVPAPENCANVSAVVLRVIGLFVVNTQPVLSFVVPSSMNTNIPDVTSALVFASVERVSTYGVEPSPTVVTT